MDGIVNLEVYRKYNYEQLEREIVLIHHDKALDIWTYRVLDAAPYGELRQASGKILESSLIPITGDGVITSGLMLMEAIPKAMERRAEDMYIYNDATNEYFKIDIAGQLYEMIDHQWEQCGFKTKWMQHPCWSVLYVAPETHNRMKQLVVKRQETLLKDVDVFS